MTSPTAIQLRETIQQETATALEYEDKARKATIPDEVAKLNGMAHTCRAQVTHAEEQLLAIGGAS